MQYLYVTCNHTIQLSMKNMLFIKENFDGDYVVVVTSFYNVLSVYQIMTVFFVKNVGFLNVLK